MYVFNKEIETEFTDRVLPLECASRGILASEGFAFCCYCKQHNIDLIIESGVYNGQSTLIWSKFFPDIHIIAIDRELKQSTIEKLAWNKKIILKKQAGRSFVHYCIKNNPEKRIAVFIDGPKGNAAIELTKQCFMFENVFVAAMHDTHKVSFNKPNKTRTIVDDTHGFSFHSDNLEFVNQFSFMDSPKNYIGQGDEDIYWLPGYLMSKKSGMIRSLGSYGPTISIMSKEIK